MPKMLCVLLEMVVFDVKVWFVVGWIDGDWRLLAFAHPLKQRCLRLNPRGTGRP